MEKCALCGKKKGQRNCPAMGEKICSLCCGTKRRKDIRCPAGCDILKGSGDYQLGKEVRTEMTDRIGEFFRTAADDILDMPGKGRFGLALERAFLDAFYGDKSVNDKDIRAALTKIYAGLTRGTALEASDAEKRVFDAWKKADRAHPFVSKELKLKTILRIVKSIRDTSGGLLGNRNYIRMIHAMRSGGSPSEEGDEEEDEEEDAEEDEEDGDGSDEIDGEDETRDGSEEDDGREPHDMTEAEIASLQAGTPEDMAVAILGLSRKEEPEETLSAWRIFMKQRGGADALSADPMSEPVQREFALWFCLEYRWGLDSAPVDWFRDDYWGYLGEAAKAQANALSRSVRSVFIEMGRDDASSRLVDCRSGYECILRPAPAGLDSGSPIDARIIWNTDSNDGSYRLLGAARKALAAEAERLQRMAASDRAEVKRCRKVFVGHFGCADPVFEDGEEAYRALMDYRALGPGNKGAKRSRGEDDDDLMPTDADMEELTTWPWVCLAKSDEPVALMFESDGFHASDVYPGLRRALDGTEKDRGIAIEALRDAVEDNVDIPITSLRRLLERHWERAVELLSGVHPGLKSLEDLKRLVERKRCEPFDMTPAPRLNMHGRR